MDDNVLTFTFLYKCIMKMPKSGKENKLINFYEHMDKDLKNDTKRDKNFAKHQIEPCSMILAIGPTGPSSLISDIGFDLRSMERISIFHF